MQEADPEQQLKMKDNVHGLYTSEFIVAGQQVYVHAHMCKPSVVEQMSPLSGWSRMSIVPLKIQPLQMLTPCTE